MRPSSSLPYPPNEFSDSGNYVDSLLNFATSSSLFQILCGGVHILDFFTRKPDLYATVLPAEWREWFARREVEDVLDLLMREDLDQFALYSEEALEQQQTGSEKEKQKSHWRDETLPPETLLDYIRNIRRHLLARDFVQRGVQENLPHKVAVGMKPKKIHEVQNFSAYVDNLASDLSKNTKRKITHLVDFGSGQNYLGRALASPPYSRHIVAVESKKHNIEGAKAMDVTARLVKKEKILRDKKDYRRQLRVSERLEGTFNGEALLPDADLEEPATSMTPHDYREIYSPEEVETSPFRNEGIGSIQYVQHQIDGGDLSEVVRQLNNIPPSIVNGIHCPNCLDTPNSPRKADKIAESILTDDNDKVNGEGFLTQQNRPLFITPTLPETPRVFMIISLHSCGNLLHHALRSLILTPSVTAVAVIGCCYNLITERLGPPTYKLPTLRPQPNPRVEATSSACDPAGYPMSDRLTNYPHKHGKGVRLNITARMMAVQAPQNWTPADSADFFTRHFFRALLQRIFLDRGVVSVPLAADDIVGGCPTAPDTMGTDPIVIGSLPKRCYTSFVTYVRGAIKKLAADPMRGAHISSLMASLSDVEIESYHAEYAARKKDLSIVWSLMAFSAGLVEAIVVVDRWLFLKEQQDVVKDAWVEAVFDYKRSPRNLVVVGVKK